MSFNIGVNVLEVEGTASPTIVPAPVSTTGFLIGSERGVPNRPTQLRSFADYVAYFGAYTSDWYGAHALYGFFQNGGAEAWAVRVVGTATAPAAATLNGGGGPVLDVGAAMRGSSDPGAWGNSLSVRVDDSGGQTSVPAQILSANAEPFALANGMQMSVDVDAVGAPVAVQFQAGDFADITNATAAEVAAAINRTSPSLRAVATPGNRVLLSSALPGSASRLAVSGPGGGTDATTPLGFTGGAANSDGGVPVAASNVLSVASTAGLDPGGAASVETHGHVVGAALAAFGGGPPAGIDVTVDGGGAAVQVRFAASDFAGGWAAPTVGELVAAINRQAAGFAAGETADGKIALWSSSWGPGSTIAVAAPGGGVADARAALGLGAAAPVAGTREQKVVATVVDNERLVTLASTLAAALPTGFARVKSAEFQLVVLRNGVVVETWPNLTMQESVDTYAPVVLNDPDGGSRFVRLTDRNVGAPNVKALPSLGTTPLTGGADTAPADTHDALWVGDPTTRTGLFAFDTTRIQLLTCTETQSPGVVSAALTYCENRGDAMFVGTPPEEDDAEAAKAWAAPFRAKKVYGAVYAPWILVANPLDTTGRTPSIWVPPVGHVLGAYARIAAAGGVWRAPAGDDAVLNLALGVKWPLTDVNLTDLVENGSVNGIRAVPGSGIVVETSRTLSTDTRWWYVNVRRLFNFVKVSLRDSLRFVAQEPHDDALRRRVKFNVVTPFLLGLWTQGAFGSDPADDVFTVKCDASNNPPAQVQQGVFTLDVFFYPVKPAEKIIITVGQQDSGATASES